MNTSQPSPKFQPEVISIPKAELQEWLQHIQTGLKPSVVYSSDAGAMLQEAYDLRGSLLGYLAGSLRKYVKNP